MNASSFWESLNTIEQSVVLWLMFIVLANVEFTTTTLAPIAISLM